MIHREKIITFISRTGFINKFTAIDRFVVLCHSAIFFHPCNIAKNNFRQFQHLQKIAEDFFNPQPQNFILKITLRILCRNRGILRRGNFHGHQSSGTTVQGDGTLCRVLE